MAYRRIDSSLLEELRQGKISDEERHHLFKGCDLSTVDLSGCNLTHCDLSNSLLFKTDFSGAELYGADLSNADATGANFDHCNLTDAKMIRTGLGHGHFHHTNMFNVDLTEAALSGAYFRESDLRSTNLKDARLRGTKLHDTDFTGADLTGADLTDADVTGAEFREANLQDTHLRGLIGFREAGWIGSDIRQVNFAGAYRIRREIMDQNYLDEFRSQGKFHEFVYQIWWLTSDCGRSLKRWTGLISIQILIFALLYRFVSMDLGLYPTPFSYVYNSIVTMTTLGYGDVIPKSITAQIVVSLQVLSGYVMLGGLLAILTNKLARRAD